MPTPTPAISQAPQALAFVAVGSANAQTFTVMENNYSGSFTESDTCANIANVAPSGVATFNVIPLAAGSCTITIRDGQNNSAVEPVGITLTSGGVN